MKKVLLLLLLTTLNFLIANAYELKVKSNLESWEYNFPIEINLISNHKEAKIFYYTDWEWRIDNIKEFKNPILLKEDTTIDFYATTKNFEDTLIQTATYTFKYSEKIDIGEKNWKIIIKNNSNDIQNIWYWRVEANNLNYEINPNTFIDANKIFEIDYNLENNEKVFLYSPDKKVIKKFTFKKVEKLPKIEEKKEIIENSLSWSENTEIKNQTLETKTSPLITTETWEIIDDTKWKDFSLNDSLKTSIIDNKSVNNNEIKNNKSNSLYVILLILVLITLYNTWLLKKSKKT